MGEVIDFATRERQPSPDETWQELFTELVELQQHCAELQSTINQHETALEEITQALASNVISIDGVLERRKLPEKKALYVESREWCLQDLSQSLDRIEELYALGYHSAYDGLETFAREYW